MKITKLSDAELMYEINDCRQAKKYSKTESEKNQYQLEMNALLGELIRRVPEIKFWF